MLPSNEHCPNNEPGAGLRSVCAAALVVVLGVVLAACGGNAIKPCESDRDCEECQVCVDGNCIPVQDCQTGCGDGCTTPPAPECIDGQTLRTYSGQGQCVQDACEYDHQDTTCSTACEDGACAGEPCLGKLCDQPPGPCYADEGTCRPENGVCDYPLRADGEGCDDGNACTLADVCKAGACQGELVACNTPPDPTCLDDDTLEAFSSNGSCLNGTCNYPSQEVDCPSGCVDGGCSGDPCAGVICDEPPGPCFAPIGTCRSGVCSYQVANGNACDDANLCTTNDRCFNGACTGDPLLCNNPPDNTCEDADTMRSYAASGVCLAGQCEYDYQDVTCSQGCSNGLCTSDSCADVVCDDPPNDCYMANGTCTSGSCYYPPLNGAACDDGNGCTFNDACTNGVCQGQPRACDDPPNNMCTGMDTLRAYASQGSCQAGACDYPYQDVTCAFGCADGYCIGDPCYGVVCQDPPDGCHLQFGTCVDGACQYEPLDGVACDDGDTCTVDDTCAAGTCTGSLLTCDTPPADTCVDADTLRAFAPVGTCAQGECAYAHQDVTCAEGCANGACGGGGGCEVLTQVANAELTDGYEAGRMAAIAGQGPFAVVWAKDIGSGYNIQFRSTNADGTFAGQEVNLGWAEAGPHGIASSGSAFAIAPYHYGMPSELWRFDGDGELMGTTPMGEQSGLYYRPPAVTWAGSQWAAAIDTDIALVSADGELISAGAQQGYDMGASLVWTGSGFGLAWVGYGELGGETYFQRYSAAGAPQGSVLIVGGAVCMDGCQSQTALAWTGSEFILAYAADESVHLARISADGTAVLSDQAIDTFLFNGYVPPPQSVAHNPARGDVAVVYARPNPLESPANELVLSVCATDGTGCTTSSLVQTDSSWPGFGWVQAVGAEYVLAYSESDASGEGYKVHFARFGCESL